MHTTRDNLARKLKFIRLFRGHSSGCFWPFEDGFDQFTGTQFLADLFPRALAWRFIRSLT
jgi:hypothetical protein